MKNKKMIVVLSVLSISLLIIGFILIINKTETVQQVAEKEIKNEKVVKDKKENIRIATYDYEKYKNLPISYLQASYAWDTSTPEKAIGVADYGAILKINEIVRTEYRFPVETVIDGEIKEVTDPYTVYSATVIESVKGELVKEKNIEIIQMGGLNEDKKSYTFLEGMNLLNVGEYYIILCLASPEEGTLLFDNPTAVIPLGKIEDENVIQEIKNNTILEVAEKTIKDRINEGRKPGVNIVDIVAQYTIAKQNQVIPEGKRPAKSILYDVEYSK